MNDKVKAQFVAQYLYQDVIVYGDANKPRTVTSLDVSYSSADYYLLLRSINDLTAPEKEIIATRMQIYPEDVIDWINGDCGHDDYENLYTWLPCYDILRAFGIALPFTYLNDQNQPETYSVEKLVEMGWVTIKPNN